MNKSCNDCNSCSSCEHGDYCNSSNYCDYSNYMSSCNYCDHCDHCNYCKNLRRTEYNYFCSAANYNDEDSFRQERYRIFNKKVTKSEYDSTKKIYHKLKFNENENYSTRFQTAFKNMWSDLSLNERKEYLDIPHFDWDIFTFITGIVNNEKKVITIDGKAINISQESFDELKKQLLND